MLTHQSPVGSIIGKMSPTCEFCPRVNFRMIDVRITLRTNGIILDAIIPRWSNAFLDDVVLAIVIIPVFFVLRSIRDAKFNFCCVLRYANLECKRIVHYRDRRGSSAGDVGTFVVRDGSPIICCISNDHFLVEAYVSNFDSACKEKYRRRD